MPRRTEILEAMLTEWIIYLIAALFISVAFIVKGYSAQKTIKEIWGIG